jgi:dihydroorotate dehydrogenase (fumarate)
MNGAHDLSTTYLGLRLANPFVVGASPLTDDLDEVRRLEDAGCAALVMRSLFEEQITADETGRIHHLDPLNEQFASVVSYFPRPDDYALVPSEYLEQLRKIKAAVSVPVIGSLNGTNAETWLQFSHQMEQAGADAIELNIYEVVTDPKRPGTAIEQDLVHVVTELKRALKIPISVKLSPFFTAFGNMAQRLDHAGADGLVLFNRFYQPDFDIDQLAVVPHIELSTRSELLLRLQWAAILRGWIRASLAICGGVVHPDDAIKAILAGADVVQMVSAILDHGASYIGIMRDGLTGWMEAHGYAGLGEARGRLSLANCPNPAAFERANYIRTLSSWTTPGPPLAADRKGKAHANH